jgi:hypothetical protein
MWIRADQSDVGVIDNNFARLNVSAPNGILSATLGQALDSSRIGYVSCQQRPDREMPAPAKRIGDFLTSLRAI